MSKRDYKDMEKLKAARKRYRQGAAGKAALKRRKQSVKGRAATKRYKSGPAGRAARIRWKQSEGYRKSRNKSRVKRLRHDVNWRIGYYLSNSLRDRLNRSHTRKTCRAIELLGCSLDSFRIYLESKFRTGMTWENYGNRIGCWTIDHIIPISLFDLTKPDQQGYCFHFSNMQPMWHIENVKKSNHITEDRQMGLPIAGL
jgi:hypothetical protein